MDAAGTALAQLVRQRMSPVVMVMPTARVEETCRKNHLGFVDLLRPFCILDQINGMLLPGPCAYEFLIAEEVHSQGSSL